MSCRWMIAVFVLAVGCGGGGNGQDSGTDTPEDTGVDTADGLDTAEDTVEDTPEDEVVEDTVEDTVADTPDDCVTSDVGNAPSDLTDACARVAACIDPADPGNNAATCMLMSLVIDWQPLYGDWRSLLVARALNTLWEQVHTNATCLAAAADCNGAFRCLHGGTSSPPCTLTGSALAAWPSGCDGEDVIYCVNVDPTTDEGREIIVPCAGAATCHTVLTGFAGCFLDDCTTADADPLCRSGSIDQCITSGTHMVLDCDALAMGAGGVCEMVDDGTGTGTDVAACVPTGAACDSSTYVDSCSGDDEMRCELGYEFATDCTDIATGWSCNATSGECVPDVSSWTCTVTEGGECDCDDLLFCDVTAGEDVRLHCPDYGMSTCDDSSGEGACVL